MKKVMLISLILAIIMLSSCTQSAGSTAIKELDKQIVSNMPDNITISCEDAFIDSYGATDQEALNDWCTYMSDKYGTTISVKTTYGSGQTDGFGVKLVSGQVEGMVCLQASQLPNLIEANAKTQEGKSYILPLEDYLKDNKVWSSLPEEFRNRFYSNGHLWALPRSSKQTVQVTSINTDWLKKVSLDVPTTLDELYEAGKAFLLSDVDGDGNNKNNYLFGCAYGVCPDVFRAYGLYLSGYDEDDLVYNPVEGCFEYALLKPTAKTALEYFQKMYKEGMIDPKCLFEPDKTQTAMMEGKYGTVQSTPGMAKYGVGEAYEPLGNLSADYPMVLSEDTKAYVLSGITQDPGDVVNAFVNIMYGSIVSNLECTIGTPELYRINSDQSIVVHYNDKENMILPTYANLIDTLDLVGVSNYIIINEDQKAKLQQKQQEYDRNYIEEGIKAGSILRVPVWNTLHQNNEVTSLLKSIMVPLLGSSMDIDITLKNQYLGYRSDAEYCQNNLDAFNKKINKESNQDVAKILTEIQ